MVIAVIAAAMVLTSSLGRWLLVLLIVTAWPYRFPPSWRLPGLIYLPYGLGFIGQAYVLPAALPGRVHHGRLPRIPSFIPASSASQ